MGKKTLSKLVLLVVALISLLSCSDSNPFSGKLWYGELLRAKDSQVLSPIVLDFQGKKLKIYANAIFGKNKTDFKLDKVEENEYTYVNEENNIELSIRLNDDNNSIYVGSAQGNGYFAKAIIDENRSKEFIEKHYEDKETLSNPDNYLKGASYEGVLYRKSDNLKLSQIVLMENNDTIKIYSNALFGVNNISFTETGIMHNLNCFKYSSNEIEDILIYTDGNKLKIDGSDFYAILNPAGNLNLSFFNDRIVSTNPSHYPKPGSVYTGNLTSTKKDMAEAMTMYVFNLTISIVNENSIKSTLKSGINDNYLRLYALSTGANYNAGRMLFSPMSNSETTYLSYYVDKDGAIMVMDKKNKTKDKYILSENNTILKWEDKASGFKGNLRLKE